MWKWWFWGKQTEKTEHHHHQQALLNDDDDDPTATIASPAMVLTSWMRTLRRRYLLLAFCSPLLLPFLCATFPLLCAAEVCIRLCRRFRRRRRRRRSLLKSTSPVDYLGGDGLRRCEESGGDDEVRLLHRYLEDQLHLVIGSVCDCCDDDDDDDDDCVGELLEDGVESFDTRGSSFALKPI